MVLRLRDQDGVPSPKAHSSERSGYEIDCIGRTTGKDNFFRRSSPNKLLHFFADAVIALGGLRSQCIYRSMNSGVLFGIKTAHRIDHRGGLMGCCRRIEVEIGM